MQYVGTELDVFAIGRHWKAYVRDMLQPHIRGRVLEIGAGKGSFTVALAGLEYSGWVCLEPDRELAAKIAQRRTAYEIPMDLQIVVGTESDLPAGETFDTVLYLDVLEHILDDADELRRVSLRLAHGGTLIVLAPAFPALYTAFDRAIGHYRRYTRESLERIRPPATRTEAAFYLDAPGALLSLANRLILRSSRPTAAQICFWDRAVIPIARVVDPIVGRRFGRSVIVVWRNN